MAMLSLFTSTSMCYLSSAYYIVRNGITYQSVMESDIQDVTYSSWGAIVL